MTVELADNYDEGFLQFWKERHPLALEDAGFDQSSELSIAYVERDELGKVSSACVLAPFIKSGILLGHHAYLASVHRSKCLVRFCRNIMQIGSENPNLRMISIETRQNPGLRSIDKLAKMIGFHPFYCPEYGWFDYLWNSKEGRD